MSTIFIWLIAAAILLIIEILSQMVWTLCLSMGCVAALCADACGLPIAWQLVTLAVFTILSYIIVVPLAKKWIKKADKNRNARTGMEALLGRHGTVTHEIKPGEMGRVRIDGDSWQAIAPGTGFTIAHGQNVVVTAYDSIIITVEPLK